MFLLNAKCQMGRNIYQARESKINTPNTTAQSPLPNPLNCSAEYSPRVSGITGLGFRGNGTPRARGILFKIIQLVTLSQQGSTRFSHMHLKMSCRQPKKKTEINTRPQNQKTLWPHQNYITGHTQTTKKHKVQPHALKNVLPTAKEKNGSFKANQSIPGHRIKKQHAKHKSGLPGAGAGFTGLRLRGWQTCTTAIQ